jgi:hypothetical protein
MEDLLIRAKHLFVAAIAARFHRGLRARGRDTASASADMPVAAVRRLPGAFSGGPGKTRQRLSGHWSDTKHETTGMSCASHCNKLKLLLYLARPEGFEPPTPRFVV